MKRVQGLILLLILCQHTYAIIKINLSREAQTVPDDTSGIKSNQFLASVQTNSRAITMDNYFQLKYFGTIYVGNKRQKMKVLFDTGSDTMWVGTKTCTTCLSSGMSSLYDCSEADGCKQVTTSSEQIKYTKGLVAGQLIGTSLALHSETATSLFNFNILLISEAKNLESYDADGLIGLSYQISYRRSDNRNIFVKSLMKGNLITELSFSMYLGFKKDDSEITFGGVNQEKVLHDSTFIYYRIPDLQGLYWEVPAKILKIGDKSIDLSDETSIVDSGTSVLCFAPPIFSQVEEYLKANVVGLVRKDLLFTYKCGQPLPTLHFTLEREDKVRNRYPIEEAYYTMKLNGECTILIDSCPKNNVLGDVFMRKFITHFKYSEDNKNDAVGFALSIADPKDNYLNDQEEESKMLYYILAGCGGGIIIIIIILGYYYMKKRRTRQQFLSSQREKQQQSNRQDSEITSKSSLRQSIIEGQEK